MALCGTWLTHRAQEYHKNPSSMGGRQYTPYAEWKFREFNELPHIFRRRLNESYPVAGEYIDQFPKEKMALVMRSVFLTPVAKMNPRL